LNHTHILRVTIVITHLDDNLLVLNETEVAGIQTVETKVLRRQRKGTACPLCRYHNCTIIIIANKANRVG
jgi:hypothetical protein